MDFIDEVRTLSTRFRHAAEYLETEEATKNALVLPFLQMMGYSIFDPTELVPEYTADVGTKKGEKVDYAVMRDGQPTILIECKKYGADLSDTQISQLVRYFHVSQAHFGILTDGVIYRFFTDIDQPNVMDTKPFLEFNFMDYSDPDVEELKRFTKSEFNQDAAMDAARELKYSSEIKRVLAGELANPSVEFTRYIMSKFYEGNRRRAVVQKFQPIVKEAEASFINDRIDARLKIALDSIEDQPTQPTAEPSDQPAVDESGLTENELEALNIIKAVVGDMVDAWRIELRPATLYTSVVLHDDDEATDDYGRVVFRLRVRTDNMRMDVRGEPPVALESLDSLYSNSTWIRDAFAKLIDPVASSVQ